MMGQTISFDGIGCEQVAERGKGVFGFVARFAYHSHSRRIHKKGLQKLMDWIAMTASQMRIAETIDAFYGDAGAKDGVSRSYKQAVEDLDAETIKALDGPYR